MARWIEHAKRLERYGIDRPHIRRSTVNGRTFWTWHGLAPATTEELEKLFTFLRHLDEKAR